MSLKEPTPPEKIFTDEFAKSGEVQKVPNDLQADENLSWLGGFTKRFSRIPAKENGLNMTRQTFAGIVQPLSAKILQVEKDLRVSFLKADKAKIKNNDISFLETPQLTTQKLSAKESKIVDFTKELIKPSEKTIITDLTQNAGVVSGIDTLSIADKAKSVNIILSPNTNQSVLNNTPQLDVTGKELVNAEWVNENYGMAPSPYVYSFSGTSAIIPFANVRGLKWVKCLIIASFGFMGIKLSYISQTDSIGSCADPSANTICWYPTNILYLKINKNPFIFYVCVAFNSSGQRRCQTYTVNLNRTYEDTMTINIEGVPSNFTLNNTFTFSKDGTD